MEPVAPAESKTDTFMALGTLCFWAKRKSQEGRVLQMVDAAGDNRIDTHIMSAGIHNDTRQSSITII